MSKTPKPVKVGTSEEFDSERIKTAKRFKCSPDKLESEVRQGDGTTLVVFLRHGKKEQQINWTHRDNCVPQDQTGTAALNAEWFDHPQGSSEDENFQAFNPSNLERLTTR